MADLLDRYVHQVGRNLPADERADIEAELRSQIQDQLDDRFGPAPSEDQVAEVLTELGSPRRMAASYRSDQYLVGPELYPCMMMILRHGWLLVPSIVLFLNVFGVLAAAEPATVTELLIDPVLAAVEATLIFSAVVVGFFALVQHAGVDVADRDGGFDPLSLPEIDDPGSVERFEAGFSAALGIFAILVFVYFLRVGGLTLRFNVSDPGTVIPVPEGWLVLLILALAGQVGLHLWALGRRRWSAGAWLTQTALEIFGAVCMYFAVTDPLFARIVEENPDLGDFFFIEQAPEFLAIGYSVITLLAKGVTLVKLLNYRSSSRRVFAAQRDTG